jgi:hypothetical protein
MQLPIAICCVSRAKVRQVRRQRRIGLRRIPKRNGSIAADPRVMTRVNLSSTLSLHVIYSLLAASHVASNRTAKPPASVAYPLRLIVDSSTVGCFMRARRMTESSARTNSVGNGPIPKSCRRTVRGAGLGLGRWTWPEPPSDHVKQFRQTVGLCWFEKVADSPQSVRVCRKRSRLE